MTDATIEAGIDTMLASYDEMVSAILAASPVTRVGVMLPVPPAATQDAFGENYKSGQTRWQYKRNQQRLVERMRARYGDREAERIFLVPTSVNLDCLHNYPTQEAPANAESEVKQTRLNNGVHPSPAGYRQIGDTLYGWIKSQL
jgi:lysophospholipase L1-like esterase